MVVIKALGHLKLRMGFKEKDFKLMEPRPLRELIPLDEINWERVAILINQKPGNLDSIVTDTDIVVLLPEIGGGVYEEK